MLMSSMSMTVFLRDVIQHSSRLSRITLTQLYHHDLVLVFPQLLLALFSCLSIYPSGSLQHWRVQKCRICSFGFSDRHLFEVQGLEGLFKWWNGQSKFLSNQEKKIFISIITKDQTCLSSKTQDKVWIIRESWRQMYYTD